MKKIYLTFIFAILHFLIIAQQQPQQQQQQQQQHVDTLIRNHELIQQQIQQQMYSEDDYDNIVTTNKYLKDLKIEKNKKKKALKKYIKGEWKNCMQTENCTDAKQDSLNKLELDGNKRIDNIYYAGLKKIYKYSSLRTFRPFPCKNSIYTQMYYNSSSNIEFMTNTNFSMFGDNGSFQTEIVDVYYGPFRFSVGSVLSKAKTKTISGGDLKNLNNQQIDSLVNDVDSINKSNGNLLKLVSGGGTSVFGLRTPLLKIKNYRKDKSLSLISEFVGKLSVDLPIAGNSFNANETYFFSTFGIETIGVLPLKKLDLKTFEDINAISIIAKVGVYGVGGSKNFIESTGSKNSIFGFSIFSAGIEIRNITIYYSNNLFFDNALSNNNTSRITVGLTKLF
ncbi:MAG: hypothetical protein Q7W13_02305 [Bacteroidia bacterium]|nr:hypothetical protein [Bacteroidia bacterium]